MNNLNFLGDTIPARIGQYLTPERHGVLYTAVIKALQIVQAPKHRKESIAVRKSKAIKIALNDYMVQSRVLNAHPDVDEYVCTVLVASMIDGAVLALNSSGWFDTEKAVDIGGQSYSGLTPAFTKTPVPAPLQPGE